MLVLCTGNVCRSPFAEAVLRQELAARRVVATVSSAGFVTEGRAAADETIELLAARGLDGREHRSRVVTAPMLGEADLVIGMAREHLREAALLHPGVLDRGFTLRELARRAGEQGPRPAGTALGDWLTRLKGDRAPAAFLGASAADDIEDPMGRRFGVHKRTAATIEQLLDEVCTSAWGAAPG